MAAPLCEVHQKPMRPGKSGGWFCATRNPDGEWCDFRIQAAKSAAASAANGAAPSPRIALAVAALEFAGRCYAGSGPVAEDAAIDFAKRAFAALAAEL